jgi:hypothetical protein
MIQPLLHPAARCRSLNPSYGEPRARFRFGQIGTLTIVGMYAKACRCMTSAVQREAERAPPKGYSSQTKAPGNEPIAKARPKHSEKSNALSGATP